MKVERGSYCAWRWCAAALLCGAIQLASASSAYAFWDWIDNLSGPGKFMGYGFDFRMVCFGEQSEAKQLLDLLTVANQATIKAANSAADSKSTDESRRAALATAQASWDALLAELRGTQLTFPVLDQNDIATKTKQVQQEFKNTEAKLPDIRSSDASDSIEMFRRELEEFRANANRTLAPSVSEVTRGTISVGSTGVIFSACSIDKKRRSSIEIDTSVLYADANPSYAGNNTIWLTTLMPMFSFRVITDPRFDFVDAATGAGAYWFTSRGFDSFNGVVIQPARFDFHAPTLWSTYGLNQSFSKGLRTLLAVPTFRFGWTVFPAGFPADAFAGVGDKHVRIPAELIRSWSLFFNFEPFLRRAPFVEMMKP